MRPQSDRAFVMGFGADIHVWQTSTADRAQLVDAVDRLRQPGWGTRFYDALYAACIEYLVTSGGEQLGSSRHRGLSDGDDTKSFRDLRMSSPSLCAASPDLRSDIARQESGAPE